MERDIGTDRLTSAIPGGAARRLAAVGWTCEWF
jgi:hypothetical protein